MWGYLSIFPEDSGLSAGLAEAFQQMKFRQIMTVLLFMVAAVVMKNALPDQTFTEGTPSVLAADSTEIELFAVLSPDFLWSDSKSTIAKPQAVSNLSPERASIPGSMIALVVTALSLVSVARRSAS